MKSLAIVTALLAAAPALAVTANGAAVRSEATLSIGGTPASDSQAANSPGLPTSLSSSATAALAQGTVFTSMKANWVSAKQGTATMTWGWDVDTSGTGLSTQIATGQFFVPNWSYSFTTGNAAGTFNGNWNLSVADTGFKFGLQGVFGTGSAPFTIYDAPAATPVSGTGSFSVALNPNTAYTFGFFNNGNVSGGGTSFDGNAVFNLDWNITGGGNAVPEPASWAMLIAGFGLVGAGMRNRRRATA